MTRIATLSSRGVIALAGADRVSFLQGLVSNDVTAAAPGRAVWAALLTPQGKWLADFFILAAPDRLLLDAERAQVPLILTRLGRFRLRADVTLAALDDWTVAAAWDGAPGSPSPSLPPGLLPVGAVAAPDPRLPEAGWRLLSPVPIAATDSADAWDRHRLALGLPDGSRDLEAEKTVLLEAGFDELGGVSWTKGCYMGQELTARTRYRGLVKRRLIPVAIAGAPPAAPPPPGTPILRTDREEPAEAGTLRSAADGLGLALLRLDALDAPLTCGGARLTPRRPAWLRLPEPAA
ncbi:MAG: folate-binding protein YgfZ [Rhodospirillales bacterium]|jgi:folate-binding protein YgfZ|nr:folate-binding protein YgfZ [Rhodospirillales bacterium]